MRLTDFKALTFDCYGTLIDWESGIYNAMGPLLALCESPPARERALVAFAERESAQQAATPDLPYPALLALVHAQLAKDWDLPATAELHRRFGASVPDWPAFPDSAEALRALKQHFKLVILSNVDNLSFAGSNRRLGVTFDAIYTAQDIGAYKPNPRNFSYLIEHLRDDFGVGRDEILHTAQSLFHDHEPAQRAGLARAWIDRRRDVEGWGATMPPGERPTVDFHFGSMAELVEAHRAALAAA